MRVALFLAAGLLLGLQELPPPFPRAGTVKLFENDRVVVWDISWLKQVYPLHRHPYDMTGVYYQSGDRVIISPEGERRSTHTDAWNITFQRSGLTHSEEGSSDQPLRAVFIEMKGQPGATPSSSGLETTFPTGAPVQRLDNDRVQVWELEVSGPAVTEPHRHGREAVVVAFDREGRPEVRYVAAGAVHTEDAVGGAARAFVFEIK